MKIDVGDYVTHIGFPPAEGEVVCIQRLNTTPETFKICVKLDCGRLQWDELDKWELKEPYCEIDTDEDDGIIDCECVVLE